MAAQPPNDDPFPPLPPSFTEFPLLRTILFVSGFDFNTAIHEFSLDGLVRYVRGAFGVLSVRRYPDTSSTRRIISSSFIELISAISIIGVVVSSVHAFYATLPGGPGNSLSIGLEFEAPFLAGFFTLFALIAAALTTLAISEVSKTQPLSRYLRRGWRQLERCPICLEDEDRANLINLQCFSDADEAENPGRQLHWYHEACLLDFWAGLGDAPPTCTCRQIPLAWRGEGGESPPSPPSPLLWAMYSFFSCVVLLFGNTKRSAFRGLPGPQASPGQHFAFVLMNGVGGLFILLLARLYYAKILYMCYLAIPMLLRHYPAFSLKESLSLQPNTWLSENFLARKFASAILNAPDYILGIDVPERVGFLRVDAVIAIKMLAFHSSSFIRAVYVFSGQQLAEFSTAFPPTNISKEWGWFLGITAVVVFLIFVHGIARRVGEVIYLMGPPLTILQGNNLHNRDDDTARGVSDSHAWFAHVIFRDVLFGRFMWFRDYFINFRASLLRDSIIVGALYVFMVALSALSFGPAALEAPVLLLCARYLGILILAFFILSVLMVVPCLVCYSAALTIWKDLFWQIVMALLTYAVTKGDFVSRIQIAESFRLPLLQVPGLGMLANIGPGEYVAFIFAFLFWYPMILKGLRNAWFVFPHRR